MWSHQAFIVCGVSYALRALLGAGCLRAHMTISDTSQWHKKALVLSATPSLSKKDRKRFQTIVFCCNSIYFSR